MIFVVEDDKNIRELVVYTLNTIGQEARGFERPSAFFAALEERTPALVLLDIMLPEMDGMAVLRQLRERPLTLEVPVIMLTAKGSEFDKVQALSAGADDYITKPFGMMELLARIQAVLRRSGRGGSVPVYGVGPLSLCPDRHEVRVEGQAVALTLKEFSLLKMLLENRGTVLTREKILDHIWGYAFDGESRTVDVHVRTLRKKLGSAGALIETVRGVGYRIGEESHE